MIICVYRDIIILVLFIQISIFNEPRERKTILPSLGHMMTTNQVLIADEDHEFRVKALKTSKWTLSLEYQYYTSSFAF